MDKAVTNEIIETKLAKMKNLINEYVNSLWQFVRGDLPAKEFEKWCYSAEGLEPLLGKELYLSMIETDFKNDKLAWELKDKLKDWLGKSVPRKCNCCTYRNNQIVNIGYETYIFVDGLKEDFYNFFEVLKARTKWIELVKCKLCGEFWYVAIDTVDDDIYFKRLLPGEISPILEKDSWPKDYDKMKNVW